MKMMEDLFHLTPVTGERWVEGDGCRRERHQSLSLNQPNQNKRGAHFTSAGPSCQQMPLADALSTDTVARLHISLMAAR